MGHVDVWEVESSIDPMVGDNLKSPLEWPSIKAQFFLAVGYFGYSFSIVDLLKFGIGTRLNLVLTISVRILSGT